MKDPKLLIAITASVILLLFTAFRTLYSYQSLSYAKKVGHIGYIISFFVLTAAYVVKYFIMDFTLPFWLAAVILLAPLLAYQLLERRK